jgi:hypothetical protein
VTQRGFWTEPQRAAESKLKAGIFVVQIRGQNSKGEDIGWMDHAGYSLYDARRARRSANDLRRVYPGVPIRVIKRSR